MLHRGIGPVRKCITALHFMSIVFINVTLNHTMCIWQYKNFIFYFNIYSYLYYAFLASKVKENVKLLISTRLEMKNEFIAGRKNKNAFWSQLLNKIKEIDPEFGHSKEQITRKCLNLITMFKRMKQQIPLGTRFFFLSLFLFFTSFCFLCISQ